MGRFTEKAKAKVSGSFITNGREKIDTPDLIRMYPKGITINGVDFLKDGKGGEFSAFTFEEDDEKFFFGGQILTDIANDWFDGYESAEDLSNDLANEPVKVKLSTKKSKNGREYTAVEVLD